MNKILINGDHVTVHDFDATEDKLPVGVYVLRFNMIQGYYLQKESETFKMPPKIYNYPKELITRWLTAWEHTPKNMGILLAGEKGSGKTITAQLLCNESKLPVILLTEPFTDEGFKQFISNPCFHNSIVFIDEFEKIYDQEGRRSENDSVQNLLSLMDGMYNTHLMFVLTTNTLDISTFLTNRPGRVKYKSEFGFLTPKDAVEIVQDRLVNMEHEKSVYTMLDNYGNCTMDIITKVIDDMNLFNEDAITVAKYMNLKQESRNYRVDLACPTLEMDPREADQWYRKNILMDGEVIDERIYLSKELKDAMRIQFITKFAKSDSDKDFENARRSFDSALGSDAYIYLEVEAKDVVRNDDGSYTVVKTHNFHNYNDFSVTGGNPVLEFIITLHPEKKYSAVTSTYGYAVL
jgi:SpoVK/Ycf46/Vps4 family AAA+-type ATPase